MTSSKGCNSRFLVPPLLKGIAMKNKKTGFVELSVSILVVLGLIVASFFRFYWLLITCLCIGVLLEGFFLIVFIRGYAKLEDVHKSTMLAIRVIVMIVLVMCLGRALWIFSVLQDIFSRLG